MLKEVLGNNKSLKNQLSELDRLLKNSEIAPELEAEVIIELTSILMNFVIKNYEKRMFD